MLFVPKGCGVKKILFRSAEFLGSMLDPNEFIRDQQGDFLAEIAFVGRSNVGKSSLINHLLKSKGLAHASSKPGKTIILNFYKVDEALVLVDFPGYGYAARSQTDQLAWSQSIDKYFTQRKTLKLILLLVDSRRDLTQEDVEIIKWALHHQKPLLLIFTKSDTLSTKEKQQVTKKIASFHPTVSSMYYTIKESLSRDLLISKINQVVAG